MGLSGFLMSENGRMEVPSFTSFFFERITGFAILKMCISNNYGSTQKNEEVKILSTHLDIKYIMFQTSVY